MVGPAVDDFSRKPIYSTEDRVVLEHHAVLDDRYLPAAAARGFRPL